MTDNQHLIAPERLGLWIAATFIIALLALVVATVSMTRSHDLMYMTQAEVLLLNKKIEDAKSGIAHPAAPANAQAPSH